MIRSNAKKLFMPLAGLVEFLKEKVSSELNK